MANPSEQVQALRIDDLAVGARIGWTADERAVEQEVRFSVELRFANAPLGTSTDELAETVDYGELANDLKALCASGEFRLIERLGAEALAVTRRRAREAKAVAVRVRKVRPPVPGLLGGASYSCGDFSIL